MRVRREGPVSARVLAHISEAEPWGAPQTLEQLAAERAPVQCSYCKEAIVHDGEEWKHVRTGLSAHWNRKECHPPCRDCDREGLIAIGEDRFVGSGIRFVVDHFLCREHARTGFFVERT